MDEKERLMVICAHIGDWVIRCGGTLAKYVGAGHEVRVVALTWGQYSESRTRWDEDPARSVADVIAIRRDEGEEAARILQVDMRCLGWDDGQLVMSQSRIEEIRDEIGMFRPHVILTHPPSDYNHPDHVTTSETVRMASRYIGTRRDKRYPEEGFRGTSGLYYFEPSAPTFSYAEFRPNVFIDITDTYETKMEAVAVINRTQPTVTEYYGDMARARGKEAAVWARGRRDQVRYAEGFVQERPLTSDWLL